MVDFDYVRLQVVNQDGVENVEREFIRTFSVPDDVAVHMLRPASSRIPDYDGMCWSKDLMKTIVQGAYLYNVHDLYALEIKSRNLFVLLTGDISSVFESKIHEIEVELVHQS